MTTLRPGAPDPDDTPPPAAPTPDVDPSSDMERERLAQRPAQDPEGTPPDDA